MNGGYIMKHLDKAGDAFDALNKEMDAKLTENIDQDKLNIDDIENKIMDKLESMIEAKLNSSPATNDDTDGDETSDENNNDEKGDNADED